MLRTARTLAAGLLLPAFAALAPGGATAAQPGSQNAVALQGTILDATLDSPFLPGVQITALVVRPGPGAGSAAVGAADVTRPWVGFEEDPLGIDGSSTTICQTVTNNTATAAPSLPPAPGAAAAAYSVTVPCTDGTGFTSYTLQWFDDSRLDARVAPGVAAGAWGFAGYYEAWGNAYLTSATAFFTPFARTWTHVQICGWDGLRYHCASTANTVTGQGGQVGGSGTIWQSSMLIQNLTVG
jgi:hypothetical protein